MNFNVKKTLLASTALIAVASFAPTAAQAADLTLGANSEWGASGTVAAPTAGDNVALATFDLTIDNTGDGTAVGAITGVGNVVITSDAASTDVSATIGSLNTTGNFTVTTLDADDATVAAVVTGATTISGDLTVLSTEADAADTLTLTLTGNATVGGATNVTAGDFAGANTILNVDGALNVFTDLVTITGGGDAAADAFLTLSGASTTFTGGLALTDATGQAILTLDGGTTAQTIAGTITGDGDIIVANSAGATFSGAVTAGTITIENGGAALNSSATFQNTVTAPITLGGAGTGTNTVTFDGTTAGFTVTGAINGAAAGETNNIVVSNTSGAARTIVQATAIGGGAGNVDNLTVSGTGTTLDSNAAITITGTATIGSGAILDVGAGLLTAPSVVNSGTLLLSGTGGVTGAITGTGALDVNASATITGAITQASADIAAVTLTQGAASGYTVDTTNFSGAGTLDLFNGSQTITGDFTNTTDGEGTILLQNGAGTTTIVGDVGASTAHSLAAFTFENAGGNANVVTTTGNWFVDATLMDATDELRFIGTTAQTVSGTIAGHGAGEGVLVIGDGTLTSDVTFNGVIGTGAGADVASITVSANADATFNANVTTDGTFTNTALGTTTVGVGATVEANDFTDTGSYVLQANDSNLTLTAADFGSLNSTGAGDTLTATNLTIDVTGQMGTGTVQLLTGFNTGGATLVDNSIQYSFVVANNGGNTDVTVAKATAASLSTGSNDGVAAALDGLAASTNTEIAAANDSLASASTQSAFNEVLESVAPTIDGGAVVSGFSASVQSLDANSTRLAALRSGDQTGMVAGEMGQGVEVWTQGFGQLATQDDRDGVDGYDADTYGAAVGIDTNNVEGATVGLALSYANTDVESDNANSTDTEIDSYQISLYGDTTIGEKAYLEGMLGFAYNDIDQTRHDVGFAGNTAQADFSSNQYIAYLEAGRDYALGGKAVLTPSVLAHYQHIAIDDYSESGAGGLNLDVDNNDMDIFELGLGAEIGWDLENGDGEAIRPAISVGYRYDLVGDEVQSTSTFAGGGSSFETNGVEPSQSTFNAGASVSYAMDNNWELTADYNAQLKSDFDAHTGVVRAGYKF